MKLHVLAILAAQTHFAKSKMELVLVDAFQIILAILTSLVAPNV